MTAPIRLKNFPILTSLTGSTVIYGFNPTTDNESQFTCSTLASFLSASARGSSTASITLSASANGTVTITLPRSAIIFSIQTNNPALVVLYSSAAAATADAGRSWATVAPSPGNGVIAQVTLASAGTLQLDPPATAINRETTPSTTYTLRVINNGSTGNIEVTVGYLTLQP